MSLDVRRPTVDDAKTLADFLRTTFEQDPASGGNPSLQTEDALAHRCETQDLWSCTEDGKVLGLLQGQRGGVIELWGKPFTFNHFLLLAVDHRLYSASRSGALRVAQALTKVAADDLRDNGGMADLIVVDGPTDSRGAAWCRLLGMSETVAGRHSTFLLPFNLIWDRVAATESL